MPPVVENCLLCAHNAHGHLLVWYLKGLAHFQVDYYICSLKTTFSMTQIINVGHGSNLDVHQQMNG